jgi:predicted DNA binding CopG/RHH family protein
MADKQVGTLKIPISLHRKVKALAAASGMKLGEYVQEVLALHVDEASAVPKFPTLDSHGSNRR